MAAIRRFAAGLLALIAAVWLMGTPAWAVSPSTPVRLLVRLDTWNAETIRAVSGKSSAVHHRFDEIATLAITAKAKDIPEIQRLGGVASVHRDREVYADSHTGLMTWNLDATDVERVHSASGVDADGSGVWVAVLDTGLVPNWDDYFPVERIAAELGVAFHSRTGADAGPAFASDTNSHGTHVTGTILGFKVYNNFTVGGVAPKATVIPVKVLGNDGSGWTSTVIAGILYAAELAKSGYTPMVVNMSLSAARRSEAELMAIRYAQEAGVVVVASAGNRGSDGMGYPGGYPEVISVGAAGWTGEWLDGDWWLGGDGDSSVPDPLKASDVYIADFSSRELSSEGQQLDLVAPGTWIIGPYLAYGAAHPPEHANGKPGQYYFLGGTSMAAPHVSGTAALMLDVNPSLSPSEVEHFLKREALGMAAGSAEVYDPDIGSVVRHSWGDDAFGAGFLQTDAAVEAAGH